MISQETLDELLDRGSILDFTEALSGVKHQSGGVFALCPFHQEKSGSFHIRDGGKFYHCFGCGASGNLFGFVMKVYGLSFPEAVEHVAQKYGIEVIRTSVRKINPENRFRDNLKKLNQLAQHYFVQQARKHEKLIGDYLSKREIRKDIQELFGLGFAPEEWRGLTDFLRGKGAPEELMLHSGLVKRSSRGELYDSLRGRIVFPIVNTDRSLVGFGGRILPQFDSDGAPKYLNSPETSLYKKSRILYGLPFAQRSARYEKEILLVEGYFDVISLYQNGLENVVATCGTAITPGHVDVLKRTVPKVTVLFDGDSAGQDAAAKAFPCFVNSGMEAGAYFFPEGEDPDSFARKNSSNAREALAATEFSSLFDCFVEYQVRKSGADSRAALSPRQKAVVAAELGKVLGETKNPIELDEYVKRAAYLLKTESELLKELLSADRSQRQAISVGDPEGGVTTSESSSVSPGQFSHPEQLLLRAIMILKEEAFSELDHYKELYGDLSNSLVLFCESFQDVMQQTFDSAAEQKAAVRELLLAFGTPWVEFWKESYQMADDPEVDSFRMLREALMRIREQKVLESIQVLDVSLAEGVSESRREELLQARLNLTRKLKTLKQSAPESR